MMPALLLFPCYVAEPFRALSASLAAVSSTHLRTAFRLLHSTQALLHLLPFSLAPSRSTSPLFPAPATSCLASLASPPAPCNGALPQSCHKTITIPATPHTSFQSASNSRSHPLGRAMERSRVERRMEAHARVCGGWMAGAGVRHLKISARSSFEW